MEIWARVNQPTSPGPTTETQCAYCLLRIMFQYNSNMPPLLKHVWRSKTETIRFLIIRFSLLRYNIVTVRFNLLSYPSNQRTPE